MITEVAARFVRLQSNPAVTASDRVHRSIKTEIPASVTKVGEIKPMPVQIDDVIAERRPAAIVEI